MSRTVFFLPAASREVLDAHDWYEARSQGLGAAFDEEIDRQVQRIASNALQFPTVLRDVRRARLRRFPYALLFRVVTDGMYVVACFHSRRDPLIWQGRR